MSENPQAFPRLFHAEITPAAHAGEYWVQFESGDGMTLRDYFAGQALVGIMTEGTSDNPPTIAKAAYLIADAMLAERAKEQA